MLIEKEKENKAHWAGGAPTSNHSQKMPPLPDWASKTENELKLERSADERETNNLPMTVGGDSETAKMLKSVLQRITEIQNGVQDATKDLLQQNDSTLTPAENLDLTRSAVRRIYGTLKEITKLKTFIKIPFKGFTMQVANNYSVHNTTKSSMEEEYEALTYAQEDIYRQEASQAGPYHNRGMHRTQPYQRGVTNRGRVHRGFASRGGFNSNMGYQEGAIHQNQKPVKRCYACKSTDHVIAQCPQGRIQ